MTYDPNAGQPSGDQGWQGQHPQQGVPQQEPYPYQGAGSSGQPYPGQPYAGAGQSGQPYPGAYGQQQPQWGQQQPPSGPGGGVAATGENPFAALMDFSFTKFATPGLIRLLYIVGFVLLVLGWIGFMISAFANPFGGVGAGLLVLVGGAVVVVFYLMFLRVTLEFFYAVVRMSEDIHKQANR